MKEQSTLIRNVLGAALFHFLPKARLSENPLVNSEQFIFTCSEAHSRRAGHGAGITGAAAAASTRMAYDFVWSGSTCTCRADVLFTVPLRSYRSDVNAHAHAHSLAGRGAITSAPVASSCVTVNLSKHLLSLIVLPYVYNTCKLHLTDTSERHLEQYVGSAGTGRTRPNKCPSRARPPVGCDFSAIGQNLHSSIL